MLTLTQYLVQNISKKKDSVNRARKNVINSATELNINALKEYTTTLTKKEEELREVIREFVEHCEVGDVILNHELLSEHQNEIAYVYQYTRSITITERDALNKVFGYRMNSAKIK